MKTAAAPDDDASTTASRPGTLSWMPRHDAPVPPRPDGDVDVDVDVDAETDGDVERPVHLPIDGVLDLHTFHPRDLRTLIPDYLDACRDRGITAVRIIHGKGTGAVRASVHALLARSPVVVAYRIAGPDAGGWGATLVDLAPPGPP